MPTCFETPSTSKLVQIKKICYQGHVKVTVQQVIALTLSVRRPGPRERPYRPGARATSVPFSLWRSGRIKPQASGLFGNETVDHWIRLI